MKRLKIDIKKELTELEFKDIILICETQFEKENEIRQIVLGCEEKTKEITPAKEACVLLVNQDKNIFDLLTYDKRIPIDIKSEGVLYECYRTKQPLMVNDVTRSFLYKQKKDNILNVNLKDLLLVPIIDDSKDKNVLAIIWAAIEEGSWNQYTQKDLEYMRRFSIFLKRFLQGKEMVVQEDSQNTGFLDCMESYDMLTAKMRRSEEYFASIIHDIRTPMNAVMGFLELLNLKEEDSEKKEYLETALKSSDMLVTLINDALDISRMANGKMNIEQVSFSVLEELSDVAKLFYNTAKKKGIYLNTFYDPNIPKEIVSDYHRIKQIMNNLLSNAIKFTPEKGEILLEILYDKERDGLTISIKDSGIGIAKEMQEKIFTPYTQEKKSTSREYGGTGLGLSISQQLSVLLGGKLELDSVEGRGSRFYFTIPCKTKKETPPSIDKGEIFQKDIVLATCDTENSMENTLKRYLSYMNEEIEKIPIESLKRLLTHTFDILIIQKDDAFKYEKVVQKILKKGKAVLIIGDGFLNDECHFIGNIKRLNVPLLPHDMLYKILELLSPHKIQNTDKILHANLAEAEGKNILVVDDSSINLKFMQEVLKTVNIHSVLAASGDEAIQKFKDEAIDLIFMDENMPGLQGSEVTQKIRDYETKNKLKKTAIISLTGDADKAMKEYLLSQGADCVLTKPIQLKEIMNTITEYI